jgi:LuxR family maltose regulon positive regulatory protein
MMDIPPTFPCRKLHRPQTIAGWINRPRLLERLDQVLHKSVASISAPAGFGKTTLLSQWLDRCPMPNAWLQLDENDHDVSIFLSGFVAALRQLFPGCLQQTASLLHAQVDVPLVIWKNALIDDLELLEDTPCILALDDYHLVRNPMIDGLLADLLCYQPLSLHLMISARRSAPLSFSRLRAQGQVVEISTADIRFTAAEALDYVHQAADVTLSAQAADQLLEKTEGWAAGLALVAISLRQDSQPENLIAHLGGADRGVTDYLLDQVFNNQPDDIREFLLKTASFSQFCAAMLCEVFDSEQGEGEIQALLERIEDAQLFLVSLDDQRTWYRYHHLFHQMLLSRQRFYISSDKIERFQRHAAAWLIGQGQIDDALNYLIAVQDWTAAAQLVEGQLCTLLNAEDFQRIKRHLGIFPEDLIATRPGLLLMQAWIAHFALRLPMLESLTGKIQALVDAAIQSVDASEGRTTLPGFESIPYGIVQAQIWMLDSVRYYLCNRGDLATPLARQSVETLPVSWRFARGNAMVYLGLSMFMQGQYQQAIEALQQEYERLQDPGTTYGARLLFCQGVIYLHNGELERCRQTTEEMLQHSLIHDLKLMQGWGYHLLGRVYQEWHQLELAAKYYHQVVEHRFTSNLMPSLESIAGYAYILQFIGRAEQAQQFLDALKQLHGEQAAALPPLLVSLITWMKLQNGQHEEAHRWAEAFTFPVTEQAIVWYHIPQIYKIKILMETCELESCPEVDQLLDEIQMLAERTHNTYTLVRALAMRAVWLARQGEDLEAQQILERAIRLGRPGWFIHAFVEQGPEMLELLSAVKPRLGRETGLSEYLHKLIEAFPNSANPPPVTSNLDEIKILLTERELEVLELLAERLSIKEIATRLHISPRTVQQHTHHIYRKLNVNKKRQAVASAKELGILPAKR